MRPRSRQVESVLDKARGAQLGQESVEISRDQRLVLQELRGQVRQHLIAAAGAVE